VEKYDYAVYATIASAIWGTSFPITKIGLNYFSPIIFAFLRYLLAGFLFLIISLPLSKFKGMDMGRISILGLTGVTIPTLLQNFGLQSTSAHITGFIQSTGPIYTVLLAYVFLREKINVYKIAGIILAVMGVYILISPQGGGDVKGNVLVLLSAISYSIGGIVAKGLLNDGYRGIDVISLSAIAGTLFLFPTILFENIRMEAGGLKYLLFLSIFTTFIAYILWYKAMERIEVSRLSFFTYLIPLFALISSSIFLGERVEMAALLAGLMAITGVAIAQKA